ncbi:MAG: LysR family transcriptional regulator, partial [Desulfovibrionales bacterium]|nr:LysR family transcriptional regulator [Desulfovibrionales bacterium]
MAVCTTMDFNIFQLRAFTATVKTGSFSAAARKLGKAQSAVSTAVMNLEIDLGLPLFDRSGRYPVLTPQGESILREANKILETITDLQAKAKTFGQQHESRLTLALDESLPWNLLTDFLEEFSNIYPHIDLKLIEASFEDCESLVDTGQADIGCFIPVPPICRPNIRM